MLTHGMCLFYLSLSLAPLWGQAAPYHRYELYIWELAIYPRKAMHISSWTPLYPFIWLFLSSQSREVAKEFGCFSLAAFACWRVTVMLILSWTRTYCEVSSTLHMGFIIPYSSRCGVSALTWLYFSESENRRYSQSQISEVREAQSHFETLNIYFLSNSKSVFRGVSPQCRRLLLRR